ncbi:hypothetical protein CNMCM8812_007326 [Aspergillus fumigatus]|nr:hypothetical protein CNMCM8812_007326 [Aspergillus fumigatus]
MVLHNSGVLHILPATCGGAGDHLPEGGKVRCQIRAAKEGVGDRREFLETEGNEVRCGGDGVGKGVEEVRREEVDIDGVASAIEGEDVEGEVVHFLLDYGIVYVKLLGKRGDRLENGSTE